MNNKLLRYLVAGVCAGMSGAVFAADVDATQKMETVTVSAGKGSTLEEMDMSTTVISREQVQQAPETTIEQIVNKIPGVFSPQQPSGQLHPTAQVFSIRGFGTTTNTNTLLMVDGLPVGDPYFRTTDWTKIPKDSIERIEVIRGGGATSMWGNMAMGGIVNVVTREPAPDEKRVNASYGSFNTATLDAAVTLLATDQMKVGLSYDGTTSDGYNKVPQQYRNSHVVPTGSTVNNLVLSMYLNPTPDSKYYLKLQGHEREQEGSSYDIDSNAWNDYKLSGGGTTKLADGGSVNVNGWYSETQYGTKNASLRKLDGTSYTLDITNPNAVPTIAYLTQDEAASYKSYGGALFYQKDFGRIKDVKGGLDLRDISAEDHIKTYAISGAQSADYTVFGKHQFKGAFAQGTYRPDAVPLDITLGLRQDYWQTNGAHISGTMNSNVDDTSFHRFDPRLGAKYYFSNGFDVRAAAYRNFAAPGMNQMYRSTYSTSSFMSTNANLMPQTNVGKEIGIDFSRPGLDVAFTAFYNKLDGFIDYATVCSSSTANANAHNSDCQFDPRVVAAGILGTDLTGVTQYVNAGNAIFRGAELLANWQATETIKINGGYTKTSAYLVSSNYLTPSNGVIPDPLGQQIGQVPEWMATLGSTWQAMPGLSLSLQLKSFPDYWNNTSHTQLNQGATLADVGVLYKYSKVTEIYGGAQNIGGVKYYDQGLTYTSTNGSTVKTSAVPALGMPFNMTVGIKTSF